MAKIFQQRLSWKHGPEFPTLHWLFMNERKLRDEVFGPIQDMENHSFFQLVSVGLDFVLNGNANIACRRSNEAE